MKKVFMVVFSVILLSACSSDDEDTNPSPNGSGDGQNASGTGLIGSWGLTDLRVTSTSTTFGFETVTQISGTNYNYNLMFEESSFSANGSYDVNLSSRLNGVEVFSTQQSIENANVTGDYTSTDNTITSSGGLFNISVNGSDLTQSSVSQTANYEINGSGNLVITQLLDVDTVINQVSTQISVSSNSTWGRK